MTQIDEKIEFAKGYILAQPGMSPTHAKDFAKTLDTSSHASLIGFCAGLAAHGAVAYFQAIQNQEQNSAQPAGKALLPTAQALGVLWESAAQEDFALGASSCVKAMVFSTPEQGVKDRHIGIRKQLSKQMHEVMRGAQGAPRLLVTELSLFVNSMDSRALELGPGVPDAGNKYFSLGWNGLSALIEAQALAQQTAAGVSRVPSKPHL